MTTWFADNSLSIGKTPLVKLNRITDGAGATVLGKVEGRNPSYSVKCRIGAARVWDAEKKGLLAPGKTIVEPTSGNTGIALAFVAAARGYEIILTMPETMSIERRQVLKAGGTTTGIPRYIKNTKGKKILSVAVEPVHSPVITQQRNGQPLAPGPHKIQGIGAGFIPDVLDMSLIDRVETVSNDESIAFARRLAREEGLLSGISCGAAAAVGVRLSKLPEFARKTIVVILPDAGERYLTSALFEGGFETGNAAAI